MFSSLRTMWLTFLHLFQKNVTTEYPDEKVELPPRYRGRIVLTRDPDKEERCVGCYLCAVACPVDCDFAASHRRRAWQTISGVF